MPDKTTGGIFAVSLDFELYWGVRDGRTIAGYEANLQGVRQAVREILGSFEAHGIHATWATVGFLFCSDLAQLKDHYPAQLPSYADNRFSPYKYIEESGELEERFHFAPDLIDLICNSANQEIGTHTFSHYYCLEEGYDDESFRADIMAAKKVAGARGLKLHSLVFPRNQYSPAAVSVLREQGILCYRGNAGGWLYRAVRKGGETRLRRAVRLLDSYLDLSGHNTASLTDMASHKPFNIPASLFLRPWPEKTAGLEFLRLRRIHNAMTHAARRNRVFHLWWHPHNFGVNIPKNMAFLEEILRHFKELREQYNMRSLNMGEIADLCDGLNHDR